MKEGWEYKKLADVALYSIGLTYKPSDVSEEGTIVLRSSNIQNDKLDLNDIVKVNCPIKESLYVQKDDILMCSRNGSSKLVGKVALIPEIEERMTYGTFMMVIRSVYNPYLFYYFKSDNFRSQIKHGEANMINQITRYMLDDVYLYIPPLSEQQSIVDYLDSAFAKIDAMKANAEKALNEAKAIFQASLKEMLEPKEGWEEKALGELSDKIGDGLHGTPKYTDDGEYFFVNGNNLENGFIEIKDNTKRVNHDEYEKYKLDLNSSTVLLSINGTIGKTAFYNGEPIILGKSACYINVLPTLLKEYLRYYFVSDGFFNYVKSNSRQATITNLGLKEIRRMPLPTPSLDEQQSIVATLDSLKSKVDRLQENFDKISQECDALKQAILRQIFE